MEDSAIVELYWQRSDDAIAETERKYGRYCHRIAYNITASTEDAEECVNDTWLGAWNAMPDKRPSFLSAFLGRITRNLALNRLESRRSARRGGGEAALALDELSDCIPGQSNPQRRLEQKELEAAVDAFVGDLPETERRIFIARYWFLIPVKEIAERLGCTQSRVKTSLYRTRKKLCVYLEDEELC
ncbi:MAG: sigma-70 family RNA polymerase sigma factor [Oscillospiraceae bacterium]|nr:sigma-70 family RNA polymerase sigma factor [Oscillospiraceae bacterium]